MNLAPHIVITSTETTQHMSKAGKPYYRQSALFVRGDGASYPFDLMVDAGRPHPAGKYEISPRSYKPNRYGVELDLALGAPIPVNAKAA